MKSDGWDAATSSTEPASIGGSGTGAGPAPSAGIMYPTIFQLLVESWFSILHIFLRRRIKINGGCVNNLSRKSCSRSVRWLKFGSYINSTGQKVLPILFFLFDKGKPPLLSLMRFGKLRSCILVCKAQSIFFTFPSFYVEDADYVWFCDVL